MAIKISNIDVIDNSRNLVNINTASLTGGITAASFSGATASLTGTITAGSFSGNGFGLTNINANNITGIIPQSNLGGLNGKLYFYGSF